MKPIHQTLMAFATAISLFLTIPLAVAQERPSGTVEIESTSVGLGIGVQWGEGVLTLNDGSQHRFKINGLKVGDVGVATMRATGEVYRLVHLDWFPGHYASGTAGVTIGGGLSGALMQNQHGVTISLEGRQQGIEFTFAAEGIEIKMIP